MTRSIPTRISRILSAACGLALMAAAAPVHAQTVVSTSRFSLTFPQVWQKVPLGSDTSAAVFNLMNDAGAFLYGAPHQGNYTAAQLKAAMMQYGAGDSLVVTAEGNKTLGGKAFSFIEFKKANPAEGEESERYRAYYHTPGSFLFQAILLFDLEKSGTAVADLESALATLSLSTSAGLRRLAGFDRSFSRPSGHDVLGRARGPIAAGRVAVPTYSRF